MKQRIHKWLWPLLCLTLLFAGACSDDDTEVGQSEPLPPTLTLGNVPESGYHFLYYKQEPRTFTLSVDAPWEITKTAGWFVLTPKSGKAGKEILITIEGDFNEGEARTGTFTVRANSGNNLRPCYTERTVELSQDAFRGAGLELTGLESYKDYIVNFPADDPKPIKFTVRGSYDWSGTLTDDTWVSVAPLQGTAGQTTEVTVTPRPNTTKEPKESELTIVCFDPDNAENKSEVTVTLRQSRMADLHEAGYVFFEDNFDWITPLWDFTTYNQPYGWPTVDASDFHFFKGDANTALGEAAADRGYTFNGSTYGRYLGFVKLGKTDENGLLATPALSGIDKDRSATLLVQFDGAYYMTATGTADTGTSMSVTVVDGGIINDPDATDEGRTLVIPMRSAFSWDRYSFVVKDATAATRIQFCDGVNEKAIKTRLFLDNVKIARADDDTAAAPAPEAVVLPLSVTVDPAAPAQIEAAEQTLAYTVRINRAWEIATDAEWLTVSTVTSGTKKGAQGAVVAGDKRSATVPATELLYDVTLLAAQNDGEARTAHVTLKADGKQIGSVEIRQAKSVVQDKLTVEGIEENTAQIGFDKTAQDAAVKFTVTSTLDWSAATTDTWYSLSPTSGKAGETVEVTLTATATNRGERRFGAFALTTVKPAEGEALSQTITVTQRPAGIGSAPWNFGAPIRWVFSKDEMPKYIPEFSNHESNNLVGNTVNALPSHTDNGPGYITYTHVAPGLGVDINNKCARVIGATGEPYITGGWPGDSWLFTVPVTRLDAGTKVHFMGLTKTSGTGQKYWLMEYFDGGVWKPVMETKKVILDGSEITYTHENMNTSPLHVEFTVTFENAIADGSILFRYTCAANMQASGSGPLTEPNGGTHRWQASTGVTIEIVQ